MPELTINSSEIAAALRRHVESFTPSLDKARVGRVLEVGDGIARVAGLPDTAVNELLEFEGGTLGLALNLDEESIGAVILAQANEVEEGHAVKATGRILSVPVGDGLIGRVVNVLGVSIDGKGPIPSTELRRLEVQAPGIVGRKPVHEPMQTGIKAIDAMTPDRPRPARADHRRPQDGQVDRRHRHDPEPAGPGREVHLRRDRPEGLVRGRRRSRPSKRTARWSTRWS